MRSYSYTILILNKGKNVNPVSVHKIKNKQNHTEMTAFMMKVTGNAFDKILFTTKK